MRRGVTGGQLLHLLEHKLDRATYHIDGLLAEVEERSAHAAQKAARRTSEAVIQASTVMDLASTSAAALAHFAAPTPPSLPM